MSKLKFIVPTQNNLGGTFRGHLFQVPGSNQVQLDQLAQDLVQLSLEHLQGWFLICIKSVSYGSCHQELYLWYLHPEAFCLLYLHFHAIS